MTASFRSSVISTSTGSIGCGPQRSSHFLPGSPVGHATNTTNESGFCSPAVSCINESVAVAALLLSPVTALLPPSDLIDHAAPTAVTITTVAAAVVAEATPGPVAASVEGGALSHGGGASGG